jgi:plasmid maintenance system antidote protein VapI
MTSNPSPLHPGKVLSEVYMKEMNLNQTTLAARCQCTPRKINVV